MASVNEAYKALFSTSKDSMDPQSSGSDGGLFAYSGDSSGFGGFGGGHPLRSSLVVVVESGLQLPHKFSSVVVVVVLVVGYF